MIEPINEAVRAAISSNPAAIKGEAIAKGMGIATGSLYRLGDPGESFPIGRLVQFTAITEDLRPLAALARLCGAALVMLPPVSGTEDAKAALEVIHDFSRFMSEFTKALLDGRVTKAELQRLEAKAMAVMKAVVHVLEIARAKADAVPCGERR